MRGIVLAGGLGTRLWPLTSHVSKQLLPIYDKPLIYYPLATLMLAKVREILIITTEKDLEIYKQVLGDGKQYGLTFEYRTQREPKGLAEALLIGETFIKKDNFLLILGDNLFHGNGLGGELSKSFPNSGSHIFTYEVADPSQYGVLEVDENDNINSLIEKPLNYISNLAITGLYFFDHRAVEFAKKITPSKRGELEIVSVLEEYLNINELSFTRLSRGTAWLDTGTVDGMLNAANFIHIIEERTGLKIACLEEIALNNNWLDISEIDLSRYPKSSYGKYVHELVSRLIK